MKEIKLKPNQTLLEYLVENKGSFEKDTSILIDDERELKKYDVTPIKNPYSYGEFYNEREYGKLLTSKDGKYQMKVIKIYHGDEYGVPFAKYFVESVNSIIKYQRMIFADETSGHHFGVTLPEDIEYIDYIRRHIGEISKNSLKVKRSIIEDPEKYTLVNQYDGKRGEKFTVYTPNNDDAGRRFISICNTATYDPDIIYVKEVIENLSISTQLFEGAFPFRNTSKYNLENECIFTPNN